MVDVGDAARAEKIVRDHIFWAIGAGLVPIPLMDVAAVTAVQLDMLKQLATHYEIPYSESEGKAWVSALAGGIAARLGANALKLIPGFGTILGGAAMAAMSGASTYAIGQVAISQFSAGRGFSAIDMERAKRSYDEHLEKGKEVASKIAKERGGSRDVFEKLEKLGKLRDQGVITPEEFDAQKKKLLGEI